MILKEHQTSVLIQKLEALLARLPQTHPRREDVEAMLRNHRAGYYGEKSLDYPLASLDSARYSILHDLRLPPLPISFKWIPS
ncbi:hypothetical protein [Thalassobacillus sp. CUG 92003]|uniref:hypothetical protein n=1 Tax=Thalassobacillus sp. CUG 92003 TaxID=2736641 RepID=UPI0015E6557C|nr:hypothetical protein [Thalassobacillus sp. CUG 92003]